MPDMPTAADIIRDALEAIGVYSPGDSITAADNGRALSLLNAMLDQWAAQTIFVYSVVSLTCPVVQGISQYTISESGVNVTAPRPDRIAYGPGAATITVGTTATSVNVVSAIEYQSLQAYGNDQGTPDTLWYNPTYPRGTLNLLPTPSAAGTLTFAAWQRLFSFTEEADVTLAVGVLDALRDNLAVEAKPYFTDSQINPILIQSAATSKDFLRYQSLNSRASMNRFTLTTNPRKAE
jgi:hypothetical protein